MSRKEDEKMDNYGKVTLRVDEMIEKSGMSKNKVETLTEIKRSQLNRYCNNDVKRIDFHTLAKLCSVLHCTISELLVYEEPEEA